VEVDRVIVGLELDPEGIGGMKSVAVISGVVGSIRRLLSL
jgi:hypothetical protein